VSLGSPFASTNTSSSSSGGTSGDTSSGLGESSGVALSGTKRKAKAAGLNKNLNE